mgnify:FL=1
MRIGYIWMPNVFINNKLHKLRDRFLLNGCELLVVPKFFVRMRNLRKFIGLHILQYPLPIIG